MSDFTPSNNITFYILPGFDTLAIQYKNKKNVWESIGLKRSAHSRSDLAETINKQYSENSQNSDGLLTFCKEKVNKDYILRFINPEPKYSETNSLSSFGARRRIAEQSEGQRLNSVGLHSNPNEFESSDSDSDIDITPNSETIIYAYDETNHKILSFMIIELESNLSLHLILVCSPHKYGSQSIHKLFEYATVMGATTIKLESLVNLSSFYGNMGFVKDTVNYSDIQIKSFHKRGVENMIRLVPRGGTRKHRKNRTKKNLL